MQFNSHDLIDVDLLIFVGQNKTTRKICDLDWYGGRWAVWITEHKSDAPFLPPFRDLFGFLQAPTIDVSVH
jgi:hypothetical protein